MCSESCTHGVERGKRRRLLQSLTYRYELEVSAAVSRKREALNVSGTARSTNTLRRLTKPFTTQRGRFIIATLQELTQQECPTLTCSSAVFHASRIQRQQLIPEDLPIPAELFSLSLPELSKISSLRLSSWKMFPRSLGITRGKLSERSFTRFQNWGIVLNGWFITAHVLESLNRGGGLTLSDIAVRNAPAKYSLSNAAIAKALSRL